jgi:hypothetical protein
MMWQGAWAVWDLGLEVRKTEARTGAHFETVNTIRGGIAISVVDSPPCSNGERRYSVVDPEKGRK